MNRPDPLRVFCHYLTKEGTHRHFSQRTLEAVILRYRKARRGPERAIAGRYSIDGGKNWFSL